MKNKIMEVITSKVQDFILNLESNEFREELSDKTKTEVETISTENIETEKIVSIILKGLVIQEV